MSRASPETLYRDMHRYDAHRAQYICRIPRRSPTTARAAESAADGRPRLASRPVAKSSHDTNAVTFRNEGQRYLNMMSAKPNLRSRSQDERSRAQGRAAGVWATAAGSGAGAGGVRRAVPASTPPQSPPPLPPSSASSSARNARSDRPNSTFEKKLKVPRKMHEDLIIHVKLKEATAQVEKSTARREKVETLRHLPNSEVSANSVLLKMADSPSLESVASISGSIEQLKRKLKDKKSDFNTLNSELKSKQKLIMEVLGEMKVAHSRLVALGGEAAAAVEVLPEAHEVAIEGAGHMAGDHDIEGALDSVVLLPNSLVCCCDAALCGQQDVVRWLSTLITSKDKGIFKQDLMQKVNEFARAHAEMAATLETTKAKFTDHLTQAVRIIRRGWSEREILVRETERLSVEVAELTSQNGDLHKQLLSADHPMYIRADKFKLEELEKELKEERCKRSIVRERLTRAEVLTKTANARVSELEVELERAKSETRALQTSVRQLQDQNLKIQIQFDSELNKLTESLKKNTMEFQEVVKAREELMIAKNNLEIKLEESCDQHNETIKCMKSEIITTVSKLVDLETQMKEIVKEKNKINSEFKTAASKVVFYQGENQELLKLLEEKAVQLENQDILQKELINTKKALENCELELKEMHRKFNVKEKALIDAEELKEKLSLELEQKKGSIMEIKTELMSELRSKVDLVTELRRKLAELENELRESESKVELYEHQLKSLKSNLGYVPLDEEEASMDCFTELRQLILEQRTKLLEATRQNGELAAALQEKDGELEVRARTLEVHRATLAHQDERRRALDERERQQARALDRLQQNLDASMQNEMELNKKFEERTEEVENLTSNVEKRKQEIHQLEEIVLTLQEQLYKEQETIVTLQRKVMQSKHQLEKNKEPPGYLDHLIGMLEMELGTSDYGSTNYEVMKQDNYSFGPAPPGKSIRKSGDRTQTLSSSTKRRKAGDSDSDLGDVYHELIKTRPLQLLKDIGHECASGSERSTSRDRNRYGKRENNHGWIRRPTNNIDVYHSVGTDIEVKDGRRRSQSPGAQAQARTVAGASGAAGAARAPRGLLMRRPLVTLAAARGHRSLDDYVLSTLNVN